MSNSNRIVKSSVPLIVDLDSSIPPTVDLESSMEASVVVLDDSYVEDALLGGGDNRARTSPFSTPKTNSNEFIRNEALATSTPAVPVNPTKPVHPVTPARPAEPVDAATPKSGEKRKRDESFIVESDDSGQEGSDEESFSSVATDRTAFLTTRDETASGPTAPDAAYPTPDTTASSYDSDDTLHNTTGEGDVTAGEGRREGVGVYDDATGTAMPDTVTILVTPEGSRVYLVGTAHFSRESQDDVSTVIRAVRPHIVCLELCKARTNILQLDEKTILEEAKNINFDKVRDAINQNGVLNGLMYILLLNMSAHLTRELGMAPGGEFRRALAEVRRLDSGCMIHLSDRPLSVTIKRALHSLSWWQTAKLTWHLVMSKEPISKEDVERCKQRDLLEQMLKEMAGEFPQLGSVFVNERDTFLAHSLRLAALPDPSGETMRVVGVVGIGHVPGIVSNWGTVTQEDVDPLMTVPPPSRSSTIVKAAFKVTAVGLVLWAAYRVLPRPRFLTR